VTIATLISFILGATLDIILLSYGARRLLAERRFSLSPTIVAGLAGQALTNAIFNALAGGLGHKRLPPYGTVLGFAALSWACGLLLAMAILVTWQAFIPAGTIPPPLPPLQPARLQCRGRGRLDRPVAEMPFQLAQPHEIRQPAIGQHPAVQADHGRGRHHRAAEHRQLARRRHRIPRHDRLPAANPQVSGPHHNRPRESPRIRGLRFPACTSNVRQIRKHKGSWDGRGLDNQTPTRSPRYQQTIARRPARPQVTASLRPDKP
jgi:hypothetical protein